MVVRGEPSWTPGACGTSGDGSADRVLAVDQRLAWLLAQGGDIVPIPGTRRSERVEENVGADAIELSAGQLNRLNDVEPPWVTATPI